MHRFERDDTLTRHLLRWISSQPEGREEPDVGFEAPDVLPAFALWREGCLQATFRTPDPDQTEKEVRVRQDGGVTSCCPRAGAIETGCR